MNLSTQVRAILDCNFTETRDEIKDRAAKSLLLCLSPPKGKWIDKYPHSDGTGGYICSNCSQYYCFVTVMDKNFCPNCGADMRNQEVDI